MQVLWIALSISILAVTAGAAPAAVQRVEGALVLEASVAKRAFAATEPVEITLTARNTGSTPLSVTFSSGQRFDLIVRRPRGDEVWRWSHDKAFTQAIWTARLAPQEALTFREVWDQRDLQGRRVDPGTYELVAVFMGSPTGRGELALPPLAVTIAK